MQTLETYRIVDARGNLLDNDQEFTGLTLQKAERILCNVLNSGADAYIQDEELSPLAVAIVAKFKATPALCDVLRSFQKKRWSRQETKDTVGIGFCCPRYYLPASWRRAKNLMDTLLVPLGLAFPKDYGRGKGKYSSDHDIAKVQAEVMNLICGREAS